MSTAAPRPAFKPASRPKSPRRPFRAILAMAAALAVVGGGLYLALVEDRPDLPFLRSGKAKKQPTLVVDRGVVPSFLIESGSIESANNTTIVCEVEALLGTVGGSEDGRGGRGGRGSSGGSGSGGASGGGSGSTASGGTGMGGAGGTGMGGAGGTGMGGAGGTGTGAGGGGRGAGGMSGGRSMVSALADRPVIQSFTYRATPHIPIRTGTAEMTTTRQSGGMQGFGDQGGGEMYQEKPGSTRIIWLIEEGTPVKPGQLVCQLDKATFEDELKTQKIRHAQALSWLARAETILEVAEIEFREYRDGIAPQDRTLIEQYIENCKTKERQARITFDWSQDMLSKGLVSDAQFLGDRLVLEQWAIELSNALEMRRRLRDYTAPRILTSLEAKIEAVKSDLLSQKAAFQVEDERLKRLERAIANCELYAPSSGIVVYARNVNTWGSIEDEIAEGVTVREGQAIIQLPDPERMRVQVKINESRISDVREGQDATILIDAFPDRPLRGRVGEVKPIPTRASFVSDVNLYNALVDIEGGFKGIRPGLSAEVAFKLGDPKESTRVPVQAIRWFDQEPYVAVEGAVGRFDWKRLELGVRNPSYAEVLDGLEAGDLVVADPLKLPEPVPLPASAPTSTEALARVDLQP